MIDFIKQKISIGTLITVFPFIVSIIIFIISMDNRIDDKLDKSNYEKDSVSIHKELEYIKRGIDDLKNDFKEFGKELKRSKRLDN